MSGQDCGSVRPVRVFNGRRNAKRIQPETGYYFGGDEFEDEEKTVRLLDFIRKNIFLLKIIIIFVLNKYVIKQM
jgi:hypothetical protein